MTHNLVKRVIFDSYSCVFHLHLVQCFHWFMLATWSCFLRIIYNFDSL